MKIILTAIAIVISIAGCKMHKYTLKETGYPFPISNCDSIKEKCDSPLVYFPNIGTSSLFIDCGCMTKEMADTLYRVFAENLCGETSIYMADWGDSISYYYSRQNTWDDSLGCTTVEKWQKRVGNELIDITRQEYIINNSAKEDSLGDDDKWYSLDSIYKARAEKVDMTSKVLMTNGKFYKWADSANLKFMPRLTDMEIKLIYLCDSLQNLLDFERSLNYELKNPCFTDGCLSDKKTRDTYHWIIWVGPWHDKHKHVDNETWQKHWNTNGGWKE